MYKAVSPGNIGHGLRFLDAAEVTAKAGFEGYLFDIIGDSKAPVSETKEMLAKTGLKAGGFGLPLEYRKDEDTFKEGLSKLEGYAKFAADIGADRCITWILSFSEELPWKENFELHRTRLRQCCEIFKDYGILFGMEFLGPPSMRKGRKYEFIHNLDQMLELCDAIGTDNAGLLLDVWHWDLAGQTKDDFKKITNEMVALVHIMDAPAGIAVEDQQDGNRCLPGLTGVLRIEEFFDGLKSISYDGPVAPEPFDKTLGEMSYTEALDVVMAAVNKVWIK